MPDLESSVTAVVINYQTPDLVRAAVQSLRRFYPQLPLLLIDNGSMDMSAETMRLCGSESPLVTEVLVTPKKRFHGHAMDQALHHLASEFVLFLDSDCEVMAGGFVEGMREIAQTNPCCYAVGKRIYMNKRGFDVPPGPSALPYIRPTCMLLRRTIYLSLKPFQHHGTPCLENMRDAINRGYELVDFPVFDYISHEGRGTAARYGYGLGLKGKLNHLLNKLGL